MIVSFLVALAIVAAIASPNISLASGDVQEARLRQNLQIVRTSLTVYKVQHIAQFPPDLAPGDTTFSKLIGTTKEDHSDDGDFGPYVSALPVNPFTGTSALDASGVAGDDGGAWEYVEATGAINADDSGLCNDGVTAHSAL